MRRFSLRSGLAGILFAGVSASAGGLEPDASGYVSGAAEKADEMRPLKEHDDINILDYGMNISDFVTDCMRKTDYSPGETYIFSFSYRKDDERRALAVHYLGESPQPSGRFRLSVPRRHVQVMEMDKEDAADERILEIELQKDFVLLLLRNMVAEGSDALTYRQISVSCQEKQADGAAKYYGVLVCEYQTGSRQHARSEQ
ncbi:hypothetical protein GF351_01775 [Candidatus Woesearchaeota archaeon]|nr:hypothetical protein [Candidatus Woesearchaeota archaeon]